MFIFVVPTLQKKWNEIRMKELAGGKCMENDCFLRTLKFEMYCLKKFQKVHKRIAFVALCPKMQKPFWLPGFIRD
jgi:hypothetical protein